MNHAEKLIDIKKNKCPHPDLNALLACCTVNGVVDISLLDAHAVRDENGIEHDVQHGPCCCGGWH